MISDPKVTDLLMRVMTAANVTRIDVIDGAPSGVDLVETRIDGTVPITRLQLVPTGARAKRRRVSDATSAAAREAEASSAVGTDPVDAAIQSAIVVDTDDLLTVAARAGVPAGAAADLVQWLGFEVRS